MRRYGEPVKTGQSYRPRPGVYAIILQRSSLLATYQAEPVPELQLPGGGIDPGEDPIPALHREVFEETGWHIRIRRRLGAYRRFTYMPEYDKWAEKICTIYLAQPVLRRSAPTEPGHTAVWLDAHAALTLLGGEGDRAFLSRHLHQPRAGRPR